jgi:hypothetical protein
MRIAASVGVDSHIVSTTWVPVGHRISGYVSQTRKPLIIGTKNMPAVARIYKQSPQLTSSIVLPLGEGRPVGALNLARGEGRVSFNAADRRWLHRLALQISPLLAAYRPRPYGMAAERAGGQAVQVPYAPIAAAVPVPLLLPLPVAVPVPDSLPQLPSGDGSGDAPALDSADQPAVAVDAQGVRYAGPLGDSPQAAAVVARVDSDRQHLVDIIVEGWAGHTAQSWGNTGYPFAGGGE